MAVKKLLLKPRNKKKRFNWAKMRLKKINSMVEYKFEVSECKQYYGQLKIG